MAKGRSHGSFPVPKAKLFSCLVDDAVDQPFVRGS